MRNTIGVFCGSSSGNNPVYAKEAAAFGKWLAREGFGLVYGAGGRGIMGAVSDGALEAGGHVHGIIPNDMWEKEWGRNDLSLLTVIGDIQERKRRMYKESAAVVVLAGGFGTLDELFESLTWSQLGYHDEPKKTYVLNTNGFFDDLFQMLEKITHNGFARPEDRELIMFVDTIDDLMYELTTNF